MSRTEKRRTTSSGVFASLEALVASLEEAVGHLPAEPTLEDITRLVEERREAAEQLANLDASRLTPTEKRSLAGRLRRVLEADQTLALALFERRDDVAAELAKIGHARRVAAAARLSSRPVRRVA